MTSGFRKQARGTRQEYTNSNTILYSLDRDYFIRVRPVTGNKLGEGGRAEQRRCPQLQFSWRGRNLADEPHVPLRTAKKAAGLCLRLQYKVDGGMRWMDPTQGFVSGGSKAEAGQVRSGQGPWSWIVQVQTDAWRLDFGNSPTGQYR